MLHMRRGLGDRNMETKEVYLNYSKGGEIKWEFQVPRRGFDDFHTQCNSALTEAPLPPLVKQNKQFQIQMRIVLRWQHSQDTSSKFESAVTYNR